MVGIFQKGKEIVEQELPICDLFNIKDDEKDSISVDDIKEDLYSSTTWNHGGEIGRQEDVKAVYAEEQDENNNVSNLDDNIVNFVI